MPSKTIIIPAVDDWWALGEQFPEHRMPTDSVLKAYGYLAMMAEIVARGGDGKLRVLEFGHMFNAQLFVFLENKAEAWGVDDIGDEFYIPKGEAWEAQFKKRVLDRCPAARFVRGYLGRDLDILPLGYFDIIASVSVFDNIKPDLWPGVMKHAFDLLRPGGLFINTNDYLIELQDQLVRRYIDNQKVAGFRLGNFEDLPPVDPLRQLIEPQNHVMTAYQGATPPAKRKYWGNFGTVLTKAEKPADSRRLDVKEF